ncbi:uncharacterized protein LOC144539359 [Centroberyx gerrardi]
MSTVMPQQPQKEDEEEEDEEQGEQFEFEDSTDEEKVQEGTKGICSDSVKAVQLSAGTTPVQSSTKEDSETQGSVSKATGNNVQQLPRTSPPAGQEAKPIKDAASASSSDVPVSESSSR